MCREGLSREGKQGAEGTTRAEKGAGGRMGWGLEASRAQSGRESRPGSQILAFTGASRKGERNGPRGVPGQGGGKQGKHGPSRAPRGRPLRAPPTVGLASPRWGRQLCQEGLPVPSAPQTRRQELNNWKHVPGAMFLHVPPPPDT